MLSKKELKEGIGNLIHNMGLKQTNTALQVLNDYLELRRNIAPNIYLAYDILLDISRSLIAAENLLEVYHLRALERWKAFPSHYAKRLAYTPEDEDDDLAMYWESILKWHFHTIEDLTEKGLKVLPEEFQDDYEKLIENHDREDVMNMREHKLMVLEQAAKDCISRMSHEQREKALSYWRYARQNLGRASSTYTRYASNTALAVSVLFTIQSRKQMTNIAIYQAEAMAGWFHSNGDFYQEWIEEPQDYPMDMIFQRIDSYLEQAVDFVGSYYPWIKKRFSETY